MYICICINIYIYIYMYIYIYVYISDLHRERDAYIPMIYRVYRIWFGLLWFETVLFVFNAYEAVGVSWNGVGIPAFLGKPVECREYIHMMLERIRIRLRNMILKYHCRSMTSSSSDSRVQGGIEISVTFRWSDRPSNIFGVDWYPSPPITRDIPHTTSVAVASGTHPQVAIHTEKIYCTVYQVCYSQYLIMFPVWLYTSINHLCLGFPCQDGFSPNPSATLSKMKRIERQTWRMIIPFSTPKDKHTSFLALVDCYIDLSTNSMCIYIYICIHYS